MVQLSRSENLAPFPPSFFGETYPRDANEDDTFQCGLAHHGSSAHGFGKARSCLRQVGVVSSYETIEVSHRRGPVGSKECACLSFRVQWGAITISSKDSVRTERTSQPFSAFRCLASFSVLMNTGCKHFAGGLGHASGLRNVKSCFTSGGRCLTILLTCPFNPRFLYDETSGNSIQS